MANKSKAETTDKRPATSKWVRRTFKVSRRTSYTLAIVFAALWVFTIAVRYPNPVMSYRLAMATPSDSVRLQPSRPIDPTTAASVFSRSEESMPATVEWQGEKIAFSDWLTKTSTNAFIVVRGGTITHEYYAPGINPSQQLPSYSIAKSVVGMLAWQLIDEGKLKWTTKFVSLFPELKTGNNFDLVTLGSLLDMGAGVNVSDDYPAGPSGWGRPIAQMYATTDIMYFLRHHRAMDAMPGIRHEYRSVDAQLAGMMVAKAGGASLAELTQKKIFAPMGGEFKASWAVDRDGGWEKGFCCLNMAARDYARLGLIMLNNGKGAHGTVISPKVMSHLTTPTLPSFSDDHWGYGSFVWHPYPGTSSFDGLHEQLVLIEPSTQTVVVKLSDAIDGHNAASIDVMHQIAKLAAL
jgi:CubicO group peptidase (beta-lactamase class C family)